MALPTKDLETEDRDRRTKNDAETWAHLEAYIAAFAGTEQEFIREFEEAGVECWLNADKR